jgi:hypothetical protein
MEVRRIMPFPLLIGAFFFASWLAMIFWGMVAPDLGLSTIGYPTAMLITIGLWLVVFPLARPSMGYKGPFPAMGAARKTSPMAGGNEHAWRNAGGWQSTSDDTVNISSSFSGTSRRITSQHFSGGSVTTNFGAVQLDLSQAKLSENGAVLNVKAFAGGIEIAVPEEWDVEFDTSAFLGGISDERQRPGSRVAGAPRLIVNGSATLGGIEVKDREPEAVHA